VSTHDDGSELEFFEEPVTAEAPGRQRRRVRSPRGGGPRKPSPPPPGTVALARLAGFVALAIAIVVGLVFWIGSCQGPTTADEYGSYMNKVRPIAQSSASSLNAYVKASNNPKLTLTELQQKLGLWSRRQQQDYDQALRLVPPAQLQAAHQQVLATLQLRAIGLAGLANILAAGGSKSAFQVGHLMANQAEVLTASDLVWANLFRLPATQTLKRLGVLGVTAPPSQIVSTPEVIGAHAFKEVYKRLNSTSTGGTTTGVHGTEILSTEAVSGGKTQPLTTSGPTTVDVAADLVFKVSVENSGDFQEVKVPVTLTVTVFGKKVTSATEHISSIQSKQTQTVTFSNLDLSKAFSSQAIVNVVVGKVQGETIVSNNHYSYPVFFSLSSGG
jgi:hypothetical protein